MNTPTPTPAAAKPAAAAAKTPGEKKPAAEKKPRQSPNHDKKIRLQKDAEGKMFGKDHNPKRPGSASAERFALYVDGMTVAEALKAGVKSVDIGHDVGKGFIKLED